MELDALELRRVRLPLVVPFRTSFGVQHERDALLVRAITSDGEGWGECGAPAAPTYTGEHVDGAQRTIADHLAPRLFAAGDLEAGVVERALAPVKGNQMAKAAVATAVLDAHLRRAARSLVAHLGATQREVVAGVSIGIAGSIGALLDQVDGYLADGYRRIKLKIEPGWDVEPVRAVRERCGSGVALQVDANGAYTLDDSAQLAQLDDLDLLLLEQPLADHDLVGHAQLALRLRTPICLDEAIGSADDARTAIALEACQIVNLKPARVGGVAEARRIHDACVAAGVGLWVGGMLETGIGRAAALAVAALPGCTLPTDLSASDRYFTRDLTAPFVLSRAGTIVVPDEPGIGVVPDPGALADLTTEVVTLRSP